MKFSYGKQNNIGSNTSRFSSTLFEGFFALAFSNYIYRLAKNQSQFTPTANLIIKLV